MAPKGNNIIPNLHFHKDWDRWVRCYFNQAGKKKSRRVARQQKNQAIAPRPTGGPLRPVVRCPTFKYNTKLRAGRGFTLQELKEAGVSRKEAKTIGITVDHRRRNKSVESLQANVQRLKEYNSKLVKLPKKGKKADQPVVAQLLGPVLPIAKPELRSRAREITEAEKKASVYKAIRFARANARLEGIRQKRADEAAAEEAMKKK